MLHRRILLVATFGVIACGGQPAITLPPPRPAPRGVAQAPPAYQDPYATDEAVDPTTTEVDPMPVVPRELAAEQQRLMDQTMALYERARGAHRQGRYDEAEKLLTDALTRYPFNADVNLLLGKIYLLKGYANRDEVMLETARLMFQMAMALEPGRKEPRMLLELFKRSPPGVQR